MELIEGLSECDSTEKGLKRRCAQMHDESRSYPRLRMDVGWGGSGGWGEVEAWTVQ